MDELWRGRSGTEASAPNSPQSTQRTVGRYEILRAIGHGGMAVVYLARQRDLDRLVAVKELSAFHAGSREFAERFLRESRLAGSLSHPNIVTVHEYFEETGIPYIAMEYVPRGSLRPWVGKLSFPQLAGVLEGILAGLAHAEPSGIVHRDLKPENIMVTADGRVKIADFGIAKATQDAGTAAFITASGMIVGTPTYMAPEQAMAQRIGPWTDLYSVGVIAHEQIVGRAPFQDTEEPMAILMRHVNERIPSVAEIKPHVEPAVSDWIDRLLLKDPDRRTASAAHAWEELEEIVLKLVGPRWRREARLLEQERGPSGRALLITPSDPAPSDISARTGASESMARSVPSESAPLPPAPFAPPPRVRTPTVSRVRTDAALRARRLERTRLSAAAATITIAAVVGFLIASTSGRNTPTRAPLTGRASAGTLTVALPASWQQLASVPTTPKLRLTNPLAVAAPSVRGELIIGTATVSDPTLLPASLLGTLRSSPLGEVVRLGPLEFYRYHGLQPIRSARLQPIYASPTTAGAVLGECVLSSHNSGATEADCERILGSLTLRSGNALPIGPLQSYAHAISRAATRLNSLSVGALRQLQQSQTPTGQAAASELFANIYEQAAAEARRAGPGPVEQTANRALAASFHQISSGYSAMASAARTGNRGAFGNARADVRRGSSNLQSSLAELKKLGYQTTD